MNSFTKKWLLVVGARPNFMKIAPLIRAVKAYNDSNGAGILPFLVHTGQHYDFNMSDAFFRDLDLPQPDLHLGVGSGNHGEQTGKVLIAFEKVLLEQKPDLVIVVGDVNSTLACALAAVKLHIPVAHVESGLRSFDRKMPEEINRLLTDAISDYLFTPSPEGDENLLKEGIPEEKIFLVGDIMVDSLLYHLDQAKKTNILERLGLKPVTPDIGPGPTSDSLCSASQLNALCSRLSYALVTLHRPANVDNRESFEPILRGLLQVTEKMPVIFPIHPRTLKQVKALNLAADFEFHDSWDVKPEGYYEDGVLRKKIHCFAPLGYLEFLNVMAHASVVLTDSGGIQEETTVLDVPCITLRDTTERPITLTEGTNVLVHNDPERIVLEVEKALDVNRKRSRCPSIWDGHTADRIVEILASPPSPAPPLTKPTIPRRMG
jgi:UDP-N-acetylglucosamine 2-epimerase (non-hydrolysing)